MFRSEAILVMFESVDKMLKKILGLWKCMMFSLRLTLKLRTTEMMFNLMFNLREG